MSICNEVRYVCSVVMNSKMASWRLRSLSGMLASALSSIKLAQDCQPALSACLSFAEKMKRDAQCRWTWKSRGYHRWKRRKAQWVH